MSKSVVFSILLFSVFNIYVKKQKIHFQKKVLWDNNFTSSTNILTPAQQKEDIDILVVVLKYGYVFFKVLGIKDFEKYIQSLLNWN